MKAAGREGDNEGEGERGRKGGVGSEGEKKEIKRWSVVFGGLFLLSSTSVGCACAVLGAESDRLSQNLLIFLSGSLTWRVPAVLRPSGMKTSADRRHTH